MKIVLFQTIQFSISTQYKFNYTVYFSSQTVLIQIIQFSIRTDFVYSQFNVKTVLFQTGQFSVSTVSMSKNSSISNKSV